VDPRQRRRPNRLRSIGRSPSSGGQHRRAAMVHMHCGAGNIGTPYAGFCHRWIQIASYGHNVCGRSILDALTDASEVLIALSDSYEGTRIDARGNRIGVWAESEDCDYCDQIINLDSCATYWDAVEWLTPASDNVIDAAINAGSMGAAAEVEVELAEGEGTIVDIDDMENALRLLIEQEFELLCDDAYSAELRLRRIKLRRLLRT
jgi:hypothetical protein